MSEHEPNPVLVGVEGGVMMVSLDRPHRRNAITGPMLDGLADALDEASADEAVQVVVLGGSGGAFSSGLDLDEFSRDPALPWLSSFRESSLRSHLALFDCRPPVIGALERFAINGAAAFALGCDLLVAGESAFLQVGEVTMGLAAPMNLAWLRLHHSPAVALQIAMTGKRVDAAELLRLGVVSEVVADDAVHDRAVELAGTLAQFPTGGAATIKHAVRHLGRDDQRLLFTEALKLHPPPPQMLRKHPRAGGAG